MSTSSKLSANETCPITLQEIEPSHSQTSHHVQHPVDTASIAQNSSVYDKIDGANSGEPSDCKTFASSTETRDNRKIKPSRLGKFDDRNLLELLAKMEDEEEEKFARQDEERDQQRRMAAETKSEPSQLIPF